MAYNQACNNECIPLISNSNLELTEISEEEIFLADAFNEGFVDPWIGTVNSAHLAYDNGNIPCFIGDYIYDPNNLPFNCLFSRWTPSQNIERGYLEEVAQQENFFANDFYTYCVNIDVRSLNCESQPGDGRLIVRTGDGQTTSNFFYESVPLALPGGNTEVIGDIIVPAQGAVSISTMFTPNMDNTYLRIANAVETPGRSFMTIDQAKVTCETSSIEDIIATQVGETVSFEAINGSPFAYTSYGWNFGDGNTAGGANPSHVYDQPGEYEVCLKIFDVNKCCGTLCKTITVNPPPSCPIDEETIFIDATNEMTNSFSDLVGMGMYVSGGSLDNKDIVIKGAFTIDDKFTFNSCNFYFEPGAELIIDAPALVLMVENTFQGCTEMWKGITVMGQNQGDLLWMVGGSISDAYAGIEIMDNANIFAYGIEFNKNYMGVYSAPSNTLKTYKGFPFFACEFTSNGTMLPKYQGQPRWETITFAGANINDLDHFSMWGINDFVTTELKRNVFDGIANGVISNNCNISLVRNEFKNINYVPNVFGDEGIAVNISSDLPVEIDANHFTDCRTGIIVRNSMISELDITNNRYFNTADANNIEPLTMLVLRWTENGNINIVNNKAENDNCEVRMSLWQVNNFESLNILDNRKYSLNMLDVNPLPNQYAFITDNYLFGKSTASRIRLTDCSNLSVERNKINKDNPLPTSGFSINRTTNSHFRDNEHYTSSWSTSFSSDHSSFNLYCCNIMDKPYVAFNFIGQSNPSTLTTNTTTFDVVPNWSINGWALHLNDAQIGVHNNKGNIWEGTDLLAQISAQDPDNYQIISLASRFTTNFGLVGMKPEYIVPIPFATTWWQDFDVPPPTCGSMPDCEVIPYEFIPTTNSDDCDEFRMYIEALLGPKLAGAFQHQNEWALYYFAYTYLKDIPLDKFTDCTMLLDFLNNVDDNIKDFHEVDHSIRNVETPTEIERDQISYAAKLIKEANGNLESIYLGISTTEDYANNSTTLLDYQGIINDNAILINQIKQQIRSRVNSKKAQAQYLLNALIPAYDFQQNLIDVWSVKLILSTEGTGGVSFAQKDNLIEIANSCSKENGQALYEARSLLESYYGIDEFSVSEDACARTDGRQGEIEFHDLEIQINPNPSSGIFIINVNNENLEIENVQITDQSGQLIKEIKDSIQIDLTEHRNGIYFIECFLSDGSKLTKKLILLK